MDNYRGKVEEHGRDLGGTLPGESLSAQERYKMSVIELEHISLHTQKDNLTVKDQSRVGQVDIPRMGGDDATGVRRALSTQLWIDDILSWCQ